MPEKGEDGRIPDTGEPVRVYVGLGSNLADPADQVARGLDALARLLEVRFVGRSHLYSSPPMGPADQPDYVNAVAALDTSLAPVALLEALQDIERAQGRVRQGQRWGPRILDLDILLYGDRVLHTAELTVPHPGLHERSFVLYPLLELAGGELPIPGRGRLQTLVEACPSSQLRRLDEV